MNKIKSTLAQLTQPNTKHSYEKSIQYLLKIIQVLLPSSPSTPPPPLQGRKRSLTESGKKQNVGQRQGNWGWFEDGDGGGDGESFKGSQISYVERMKGRQVERRGVREGKQDKINLRQFQESIQIYHQCLSKTIQVIELQHQNLMKLMNKGGAWSSKLQVFWQRYNQQKLECKKFKDLLKICHQSLSKQFLPSMSQITHLLSPTSHQKPQKYLLLFQ